MNELHEPLHEAYDVDVAKLNRLAARSAERAEKLKAENEKLRELIADVHEALKADKAGMFHRLTLASMEEDMRDLGIEADDG